MILQVENYIETLYPEMTFGQIQDTPDNLVNINMSYSSENLYFNNDTTGSLHLNVFIRANTYEEVMDRYSEIDKVLTDIYDTKINKLHIIHTKLLQCDETIRDNKNRYYKFINYSMLIEEV